MTKLKSAAKEYEKAEITCLFLHSVETDEKINLLTIFELIPSEQQSSDLMGNRASYFTQRERIDKKSTLLITRIINLNLTDALEKYDDIQNGLHLKYKNLDVEIKYPQTISTEPPSDFPLLIQSNQENTIGRILPKRKTSFRVWSKINTDKEWLSDCDKEFYTTLRKISTGFLGYDLSAMKEHIGNVYLCACNPIIRSWNTRRINDSNELLLMFNERVLKSIEGCELVIEEERAKRTGFIVRHIIKSNRDKVSLPYFPDAFHKKIYNKNGDLIQEQYGAFRNFQINLGLQGTTVNLKVESKDGEEIHSIPKTSNASTLRIGNFDFTNAHYLSNAVESRRHEELEKTKEFIYFPKEARSKAKARATVRELLNDAKERCMILDPYFQAVDIEYAIFIQNISIPVQIISSVAFLSQKIKAKNSNKVLFSEKLKIIFKRFLNKKVEVNQVTHALRLKKGIDDYHKAYSQQTIICKILRGKKSPLHDRYIIIDDKVYLLGSSLNEFGSRATTIIKVPSPKPLIEQAETWWGDEEKCPSLEEYLSTKI